VEDLMHRQHRGAGATHGIRPRIAVMTLFGTMNWLYTWHNPRVDPGAEALAQQICDLFLCGIRGEAGLRLPVRGKAHHKPAARAPQNKLSGSTHE